MATTTLLPPPVPADGNPTCSPSRHFQPDMVPLLNQSRKALQAWHSDMAVICTELRQVLAQAQQRQPHGSSRRAAGAR